MSAIAIITARGGSKRIPRKNIKPFMGRPMLAYAISAARESGLFDEIMVSTEDEEIAAVARANGADVPFMRSARTAGDYATTFDVLEEVLARYASAGREFDVTCCIYPCVPFLRGSTLCKAADLLGPKVNAVLPVCRYPVPIEWAMIVSDGELKPRDQESLKIRSQDLTPKYYDVGMFYFVRSAVLLQEKTLIPAPTAAFEIDALECQDIDTPEDWSFAETKYRLLNA